MAFHEHTRYSDDYSLQVGLLSSFIVHTLLLILFTLPTQDVFRPEPVIDVTIEPPQELRPPPEAKKQMVSPSEPQNVTPPKEVTQQSDTDNSVLKEQVKRGAENSAPSIGDKGPPSPRQKASPQEVPQKSAPQPKPETAAPKPLTNLKLDTDTLINEFALSNPAKQKAPGTTDKNQRIPQNSYKAFSRPMGSGARFIGLSGSSDYLPNLPDGDITLLNTKANKFAVFVRRVATQVFSQIRSQGWDVLRPGDISSISGYATVKAVLSPTGKLLKVELESSSQSERFDEVIIAAARKGATDPNPPKEAAASDGNVHFIFQAKSWVEIVPAPRSALPTERRWLLLATGLD